MLRALPHPHERHPVKRPVYRALGFASVGLGAIGAALPIMPTVPFLLLAVFFFARSSPELEQRILDHPTWGPQVKDWRERRAIGRPAKLAALTAMSAGVVFTGLTLGAPWIYLSIAILVICGSWIWTRNE
ncbi:MAG: DUF454 domain-containing protein [Sphingomonadales bacterium]|nr:MAG: DUF454 domain-containing protein [Sphingomonadales bacterium]